MGPSGMLLEVKESWLPGKKLVAMFDDHAPVHFGARGYMNYGLYKRQDPATAELKRRAYIARHSATEDWTDPHRAGTLARYLLWEFSEGDRVRRYNELFGASGA